MFLWFLVPRSHNESRTALARTLFRCFPWGKRTGLTRLVELNQIQFFASYKKGSRSNISCITSVFERGPKRGIKDFCRSREVMVMCKDGRLKEAANLLDLLDQQGIKVNSDTYVCLLQWCTNLKTLSDGKQVHAHIIKSGLRPNMFLGNTLVNMYTKCGSLADARRVFNGMPNRNVFSWTMMITAYTKCGYAEEAFKLFYQMEQEGVKPDKVTFVSILKACTGIGALEQAKQIHTHIMKSEFELDVFVGSTLVDVYSKCGGIEHARLVFDKMPERDVVLWNAMISGYAKHHHAEEAFKLFLEMEHQGFKPDEVTFLSILNACASLGSLKEGKRIHALIIKSGFESHVFLGNTLIDMYAKCGSIEHAREVFHNLPKRDVVSWNVMIAGCVQHGHGEETLNCFSRMQQEGVKPNDVTFCSVLNACSSLLALEQGKQIHAHIINSGFEADVFVGSALVDMYAKCGGLENAHQVFNRLRKRDVVTWSVMIAGYIQHGLSRDGFKLFLQMQQEGVKPDAVTFVSVLNACSILASLEQGKQIHAQIIKSGFESDVNVGNSLVDMYAKCGSIELAHQVFNKMPKQDVVSWTVMIAGYAQHGCGSEALQLVDRMQQEGVKLDHVTFTNVLSACSHAGLVDDGRRYFDSISQDYGISPATEHYACMVDLLGRAGHLEEAQGFVKKMPFQPSALVWMTLLGACRIHGNVVLAKHIVGCILDLEPQNTAALVVVSNIYAAAGRWDNKANVIKMMDRGVKKEPGHSCIEVNYQVHSFVMEDTLHPQMKEVHT